MSISISNKNTLEAVKVLPFKDPRKAAFPDLQAPPSQLRDATVSLSFIRDYAFRDQDGNQDMEAWLFKYLAPDTLPERFSLKDNVEGLFKSITDQISKTQGPEYQNLTKLLIYLKDQYDLLQILWDKKHAEQTA